MRIHKLCTAALAAVLAACAPGASPEGGDLSVVDLAGRTVALDGPAGRVVALTPAINEWIVAMGGADRLVARTDYDDHPAIAHLPSVGGGLTPSVEWLAARRPDLVVAWPDAPSRSLVARLEELGIAVYTAPIESVEQAFTVAADLGVLLGLEEGAAAAVDEVRAGFADVRERVADRPQPAVLFLIGLDPLMAAGPGTFVDELLAIAGGRNALHDLDILWPSLSLEEAVRRAPDVILVGSAAVAEPLDHLSGRPGWREVPAVRHGAVHGVDPDQVNRPGPGMDEAAALLADRVHGTARRTAGGSGPGAP